MAETDRPAEPGTLWVTPDGIAYRLTHYSTDWLAEPFTGEETRPKYSIGFPAGGFSNRDDLPADAVLVWAPDPEPVVNPRLLESLAKAADTFPTSDHPLIDGENS